MIPSLAEFYVLLFTVHGVAQVRKIWGNKFDAEKRILSFVHIKPETFLFNIAHTHSHFYLKLN